MFRQALTSPAPWPGSGVTCSERWTLFRSELRKVKKCHSIHLNRNFILPLGSESIYPPFASAREIFVLVPRPRTRSYTEVLPPESMAIIYAFRRRIYE